MSNWQTTIHTFSEYSGNVFDPNESGSTPGFIETPRLWITPNNSGANQYYVRAQDFTIAGILGIPNGDDGWIWQNTGNGSINGSFPDPDNGGVSLPSEVEQVFMEDTCSSCLSNAELNYYENYQELLNNQIKVTV